MLKKRVLGIIVVILGVSLILSSFYIKSRVSSGRKKISEAKESVSKGKQLFSLNPLMEKVGKSEIDAAEKKIKEGSAKADRYEKIALWFNIGGGIFIVIGAGLILISIKRK